jgi:catechol-2,3-dioxygenase
MLWLVDARLDEEAKVSGEPVNVLPKINHLVLKVRDLDRSVAFYCTIFAYEEAMERFGDGVQAFLRARGSDNHHDLSFQRVASDAPAPGRGAVGLYHFALEVPTLEDLLAVRERMLALNAFTAEFNTGASLSVYGRDPDGHTFEVMWEIPRAAWGEYTARAGALPVDFEAALQKWGRAARPTPSATG